MEIEPLLQKLSALSPRFGRLREDIDTMALRGRSGDFKGVMQNARLVLEALLRSLVTEELKQTPGKAMLDELVTKFRQQANAGIIPTNILAHMGTVQAWGNLSSHDHAGSLKDESIKVGNEEVVASLNSVVAILAWYAEKRGLTAADATQPSAQRIPNLATPQPQTAPPPMATPMPGPQTAPTAPMPQVAAPAAPGSKLPLILGGVGLLAAAGAAAIVGYYGWGKWFAAAPRPVVEKPAANPYEALDAVYASWKEPPPPASCRNPEEAARLSKVTSDLNALGLIANPGPEAAYLLARASFEQRSQRSPVLAKALECQGFASAELLAARLALKESEALEGDAQAQKLAEVERHIGAATQAAPKFLKPRLLHAGLLRSSGKLEDALAEMDGLVKADPDYGQAYVVRSVIYLQLHRTEEARHDCQQAMKLGEEQARKACAALLSSP